MLPQALAAQALGFVQRFKTADSWGWASLAHARRGLSNRWLDDSKTLVLVLIIPSATLILGVLLYPMLYSFVMSLTDRNLADPTSGGFIGFANYISALTNPYFWHSMSRTLYFAICTVPVEVFFGMIIALVLNQKFRGRWFVRGLIILPWALPYVVNGIMWKWIYDANYGALNALLVQLHLIRGYHVWLGNGWAAMNLVVLANIWKETPVAAILLLAAMQTIPLELYEAAAVDGATAFQRFRVVTLPLIRPVLAVTAVIKTVWAIKEFDLIYIITRGGPADATNVVTFYTYLNTFKFMKMGYGSALAYLLTLVIAVLAILYTRGLSAEEVQY